MKLHISEIGEGCDLSFTLSAEALSALLELPEGDLRGLAPGLEVQGRAELIERTILLRGVVRATVGFTCVRCTEPQALPLELPLDAVLEPPAGQLDPDLELTEDDLNISYYSGDVVDLAPLVREAILLEVPPYPACEEGSADCAAAQRRNLGDAAAPRDEAEPSGEDSIDPRWAALKSLRNRMGET